MPRRIAVLGAAVVAVVCSAATAQETMSAGEREVARVRFIHAVPDGPPVSVKIGNQEVFTNVAYRQVTELKSLVGRADDEELKVVLTPAGGGAAIESDRGHEFDDTDEDYTILATAKRDGGDGKGGVEITVFKLDRLDPKAEQAQVSLVNAVPDVRALDLFVDQKKVHAGVNYKGHNGPDKIDSGPHTLSIKTADEQVVMQPRMVNMRPGQSYTVVAMGMMAGGAEALAVEDALGATGGAEASAGTTGAAMTTGTGAMSAPESGAAMTTGSM